MIVHCNLEMEVCYLNFSVILTNGETSYERGKRVKKMPSVQRKPMESWRWCCNPKEWQGILWLHIYNRGHYSVMSHTHLPLSAGSLGQFKFLSSPLQYLVEFAFHDNTGVSLLSTLWPIFNVSKCVCIVDQDEHYSRSSSELVDHGNTMAQHHVHAL